MAGKNDDPLIWGIMGLAAGLILLFFGIRRHQLKQRVCNTPTSKVSAVAMGAVEVYGKVRPTEPLKSPAKGTDCAYCKTDIYRWQKTGKHHSWVLIKTKTEGKKFIIEDETGSMEVDSEKAQIEMPDDFVFETSGEDAKLLPHDIAKLFSDWGVKYQFAPVVFGLVTPRERLRVVEKYLAVGDMVYVYGTAQPVKEAPKGNPSVKDAYIGARGGEFLFITDSPEKKIVEKMFVDIPLWIVGGIILTCAGLGIVLWRIGVR